MTAPDKEKIPAGAEPTGTHQTTKEATTGILTTGSAAICFLLAFTYLHGTEQLLLISLGGLLAGGSAR